MKPGRKLVHKVAEVEVVSTLWQFSALLPSLLQYILIIYFLIMLSDGLRYIFGHSALSRIEVSQSEGTKSDFPLFPRCPKQIR